jgi:hypothetical protein
LFSIFNIFFVLTLYSASADKTLCVWRFSNGIETAPGPAKGKAGAGVGHYASESVIRYPSTGVAGINIHT